MQLNDKKEYHLGDFQIHELQQERFPLEKESALYIAVSEGNMPVVKQICESNAFTSLNGAGVLSENPVTNIRYHFVIATAMITRFCVKKGLVQDTAYGISDYYIQKMDKVHTIADINRIHTAMCYDFCENMIAIKKSSVISRSIVKALDYIYTNIHYAITLPQLAEHVGLSESYFSKLFAKEIGMSVHEYICRVKIEKASNLLCYSDYSIADIANYLAFSSESHFISVFKKYEKITPNKYRNIHFRESWNTSDNNLF